MAFLRIGSKKRNVKIELENPISQKEATIWEKPEVRRQYQVIQAFLGLTRNGLYGFSMAFNGEKDLGGIGPLVEYFLDYEGFRVRSWKAYLDSEIAQTVLGKFKLWNIGKGLKMQVQPIKEILSAQGIELTEANFNKVVEAGFQLYMNSVRADYSGMLTGHQMGAEAFLNSKVGGDVLCILRYENDEQKIQIIDATHVQNPIGSSPYIAYIGNAGNILKNGIELDLKGRHVAYYVRTRGIQNNGTNDLNINFDSERIPAYSESSGLPIAFLIYGFKYRLDNVRGIPLISAVMQTMTGMERYKEAMIGAAEEAAKIVYTVEHDVYSEGEDPFQDLIKHARGTANMDKIPIDNDGRQVADKIQVSTNKTSVNMPRGAHLKAFTGAKELYFKDFYTVNIQNVCATVNIPYAVAMSTYDTSYSSSRAAIKDWEHTINVNRHDFAIQFYQKVYAFWLDIEILKGNIKAPGYLEARLKNDFVTLEAYRHARFVGAAVPHIDPVKEVEAQRLLMGITGDAIPLTTVEAATEALNTGESDSNMEQYATELEKSKTLKLEPVIAQNVVAKSIKE
jgi:capsid protein